MAKRSGAVLLACWGIWGACGCGAPLGASSAPAPEGALPPAPDRAAGREVLHQTSYFHQHRPYYFYSYSAKQWYNVSAPEQWANLGAGWVAWYGADQKWHYWWLPSPYKGTVFVYDTQAWTYAGYGEAETTPAQAGLAWLGKDADLVSPPAGGPDGTKDAHFRLTLSFPSATEIKDMYLTQDGTGNEWASGNSGYWMLAAYRNGARLNQSFVSSLGTYSGAVALDLYAPDTGSAFVSGNSFTLRVNLGNGTSQDYKIKL